MTLNRIQSISYRYLSIYCLVLFFLCGCQLSPHAQVSQLLKDDGYRELTVSGAQFKHLLLENPALHKTVSQKAYDLDAAPDQLTKQETSKTAKLIKSTQLHVYIEGDGRPWWTRRQVARDPTRGELVALSLMALDSRPSLYLGRPCYFNLDDPACAPEWWTQKRYAQEVRQSLSAVIDHYADQFDSICVVGFSGGGSLAMLLANYRNDIKCVVTIASNLNTEEWAQHHSYSPLHGSINPATLSYDNNIRQLHLAGGKDKAVPAQLIAKFVDQLKTQQAEGSRYQLIHYQVYKEFSHRCCWKKIWPEVLSQLRENQLKKIQQ